MLALDGPEPPGAGEQGHPGPLDQKPFIVTHRLQHIGHTNARRDAGRQAIALEQALVKPDEGVVAGAQEPRDARRHHHADPDGLPVRQRVTRQKLERVSDGVSVLEHHALRVLLGIDGHQRALQLDVPAHDPLEKRRFTQVAGIRQQHVQVS